MILYSIHSPNSPVLYNLFTVSQYKAIDIFRGHFPPTTLSPLHCNLLPNDVILTTKSPCYFESWL